jgi:hypothetical protein
LIVAELDLGYRGGEQFNDGSNLAANKALLWHIFEYGYFRKKFHLPQLLILKNIARDKPRGYLATQDNPATPNLSSPSAVLQLKVYDVPSSVLIGNSNCGIFFQGRIDQRCAKFFGMSSGHPQEGLKDSRLMPSARMPWTQTIVSKFFDLDNRCLGVR